MLAAWSEIVKQHPGWADMVVEVTEVKAEVVVLTGACKLDWILLQTYPNAVSTMPFELLPMNMYLSYTRRRISYSHLKPNSLIGAYVKLSQLGSTHPSRLGL